MSEEYRYEIKLLGVVDGVQTTTAKDDRMAIRNILFRKFTGMMTSQQIVGKASQIWESDSYQVMDKTRLHGVDPQEVPPPKMDVEKINEALEDLVDTEYPNDYDDDDLKQNE